MNNLARMVTGDRIPSGSKILDEHCRTFLLVMAESAVESIRFGMKLTLSDDVFQCNLRKFTT